MYLTRKYTLLPWRNMPKLKILSFFRVKTICILNPFSRQKQDLPHHQFFTRLIRTSVGPTPTSDVTVLVQIALCGYLTWFVWRCRHYCPYIRGGWGAGSRELVRGSGSTYCPEGTRPSTLHLVLWSSVADRASLDLRHWRTDAALPFSTWDGGCGHLGVGENVKFHPVNMLLLPGTSSGQ